MKYEKMRKYCENKQILYPDKDLIEFIEQEAKKEVFDDLIKKIEWLKLILSGTVLTKEKDIYYWIDKAFEDAVEKH